MSQDKRLPASTEPGQIHQGCSFPSAASEQVLGDGCSVAPSCPVITVDHSLPLPGPLLAPRQSPLACPARTGSENVRSQGQSRRPASGRSRQVLVREAQRLPEDLVRTDRLAALLSQALSQKLARSNASGPNGDTQLDYVPNLRPTTGDQSTMPSESL